MTYRKNISFNRIGIIFFPDLFEVFPVFDDLIFHIIIVITKIFDRATFRAQTTFTTFVITVNSDTLSMDKQGEIILYQPDETIRLDIVSKFRFVP